MNIKIKKNEPFPFGYKLIEVNTKSCADSTIIELVFKTNESNHSIDFEIRGNGLLTNLSILKFVNKIKKKNIADCIKASLEFVNEKGTFYNCAYFSIINGVPLEVIQSEKDILSIYRRVKHEAKSYANKKFGEKLNIDLLSNTTKK